LSPTLRDFILIAPIALADIVEADPNGSTECPSLRGDGVLIGCVSPSPPGTSQMARGFIPPLVTGKAAGEGLFPARKGHEAGRDGGH
jgi:hypothetical protein